jgi:hypothetical protein
LSFFGGLLGLSLELSLGVFELSGFSLGGGGGFYPAARLFRLLVLTLTPALALATAAARRVELSGLILIP